MKESLEMNFIELDSCTSTNDELFSLAKEGAAAGTVVSTRMQTKGKGTKGRSFHSPDKTGVYMSVLLKDIKSENMLHVTPLAAVIVSQVLDELCKVETQIKWVNDIYLEKKKVCGILTQAQSSGKNVEFIIVGIGINLFKPVGGFPDELKDIAGFVLEEYDKKLRFDVMREISGRFVEASKKIGDKSFRDEFYEYYNERQYSVDTL